MTRTKICGITHEADLRAAIDAGADAVGVIAEVSVDTPREVPVERAAELVAAAPPTVSTVLVTMAPTTGRIVELAETVEPDAVQVHGDISPQRLVRLGTSLPADVIAVADAEDPREARRYDGVADAIIVDSVSETGAGGTGETHDWERTRETASDIDSPVVLAGGLTPDNVAEAVRTVDPFAVDVASGVESTDGRKKHEAVERFLRAVRGASATAANASVGGTAGSNTDPDGGAAGSDPSVGEREVRR